MPRLTANSFDDPAWAIVTKGWDQCANGRFDEAIASYTAALNSFSARTSTAATRETYICRGVAFGRSGNEHSAMKDFTKAIALDPERDIAYYNRGISRQTLGLHDQAIGDFSRVIELRPTCVSSFIRRGVCLKRLNDIQGARSDFAEARRLMAAENQDNRPKVGQRPKTVAAVGMRFPPPPGTQFYVWFSIDGCEALPPCEEMPSIVADNPRQAIEQVLRDGNGPTDKRLQCGRVFWINHNGRVRDCIYSLDTIAGTT